MAPAVSIAVVGAFASAYTNCGVGRRLGLNYSDWQILHAALAVAIVGSAVGHTILIRGTLDGPVEILLRTAAVLATSAAAVYRLMYISRPNRGAQAPRW